MIVVTEHRAGDEFLDPARELLEVLAGADGFLSGQVARSPDEPEVWIISTQWRDVGSMRRGFGSFDAKSCRGPGHGERGGSGECLRGVGAGDAG